MYDLKIFANLLCAKWCPNIFIFLIVNEINHFFMFIFFSYYVPVSFLIEFFPLIDEQEFFLYPRF